MFHCNCFLVKNNRVQNVINIHIQQLSQSKWHKQLYDQIDLIQYSLFFLNRKVGSFSVAFIAEVQVCDADVAGLCTYAG